MNWMISLAARIVSIADVFDALTSKRPYKDAWSAEAGLKALLLLNEQREIKADVEEVLPPDSSGIVAVFEERWSEDLDQALKSADVIKKEKVDRESAEQVKAAARETQPAAR